VSEPGTRVARRGRARADETTQMRRLRQRIDALDRRIVTLLSERARLGRDLGALKSVAGRPTRDPEREREVLLRVAAANEGPLPQTDLLAIYRRVISATRRLEALDRRHH